jgi:hypothetical protein
MTDAERKLFRKEIGGVMLSVQDRWRRDLGPEEVVPEMIAALLSLAHYIARSSTGMSSIDFIDAAVEVAREEIDG